MDSAAFPKGQLVHTPAGPGSVVEVIGEHVIVKLESGDTRSFDMDAVIDDSSAG